MDIKGVSLEQGITCGPEGGGGRISRNFLGRRFHGGENCSSCLGCVRGRPSAPVVRVSAIGNYERRKGHLLALRFYGAGVVLVFLVHSKGTGAMMRRFSVLANLLKLRRFHGMFPVVLASGNDRFGRAESLRAARSNGGEAGIFCYSPRTS